MEKYEREETVEMPTEIETKKNAIEKYVNIQRIKQTIMDLEINFS